LDILDKDKTLIKHRLYRNHTSISGISFVKDLSKIGRDLSKVIIIDNLPDNFKLQQNNGFFIKTWNEDMKDTQLFDFAILLKDLYELKVPDVRIINKKIKDEVLKRSKKNILNPYANIDLSKLL
jgi:CTD small phosphatase-like protein 2